MSKKKWCLLAAMLLVLGGIGVALLLALVRGVFAGREEAVPGSVLSVYQLDQTASSHAGYRCTTLTAGREVFVNDYAEAGLELANPEPHSVIGRYGIGVGNVYAIPGQPVCAYIAGDVGSEMPAYVPFRNRKQPPFDWRTAVFREMTLLRPGWRNPRLTSTNTTLLAAAVSTLRDDPPVVLPEFPFAGITRFSSLRLTCDLFPGMVFSPRVYFATNGTVYLAESLMLDAASTPPQLSARWIPARPALAHWLATP